MRLYWILGVLLSATVASAQTDPTGMWEGRIDTPGTGLQISVALAQSDDGWRGTIDIPVQGASGMPLTKAQIDDRRVSFGMQIPGNPTFRGIQSDDSSTIRGSGLKSNWQSSFPSRAAEVFEMRIATDYVIADSNRVKEYYPITRNDGIAPPRAFSVD